LVGQEVVVALKRTEREEDQRIIHHQGAAAEAEKWAVEKRSPLWHPDLP